MVRNDFFITSVETGLPFGIPARVYLPESNSPKGIVIAVHGFAGDKDSSVIKALAERLTGFNVGVLCFDFPAHGESTASDEMLTVENCVASLIAVAAFSKNTYTAAEFFNIFATSFGGYVSIIASRELREVLGEVKYALRAPAVCMGETLLEKILCLSETEFAEKKTVTCGFDRKIELSCGFYGELKNNDVCKNEFDESFIVIHGDRDELVLPRHIEKFLVKSKRGRLFVIEGADHRFKNAGELEKIIDISGEFLCC